MDLSAGWRPHFHTLLIYTTQNVLCHFLSLCDRWCNLKVTGACFTLTTTHFGFMLCWEGHRNWWPEGRRLCPTRNKAISVWCRTHGDLSYWSLWHKTAASLCPGGICSLGVHIFLWNEVSNNIMCGYTSISTDLSEICFRQNQRRLFFSRKDLHPPPLEMKWWLPHMVMEYKLERHWLQDYCNLKLYKCDHICKRAEQTVYTRK